jgi:hypothetical protein
MFWQVTEMSDEDVSFLASLPYTLALLDYNVTVVHAGLVPGVPLHKQDLGDVVEMRELVRKSEGDQKSNLFSCLTSHRKSHNEFMQIRTRNLLTHRRPIVLSPVYQCTTFRLRCKGR